MITKLYKNFNVIFRKFCNVDINIVFFHFKTHCYHIYGAELWYNNLNCNYIIIMYANGYHTATKRILKVPKWESNHLVCEATGHVTFEHYIDLIQVVLTRRLLKNPLLLMHKLK